MRSCSHWPGRWSSSKAQNGDDIKANNITWDWSICAEIGKWSDFLFSTIQIGLCVIVCNDVTQNWTFWRQARRSSLNSGNMRRKSCLAFSQSKKRYPACSHIFFSLSQAFSLLFLDYVVCLHFNRWIEWIWRSSKQNMSMTSTMLQSWSMVLSWTFSNSLNLLNRHFMNTKLVAHQCSGKKWLKMTLPKLWASG